MSLREERKQKSHQAILDAALRLSSRGRAFSNISLRELSREVELVPTALYRHFKDMQQLGIELLDQTSLHIKSVLNQLGQAYFYQANTRTSTAIELFFQAVESRPEPWLFFISERWGGSDFLRSGIEREVHFLVEDLMHELEKMQSLQQMNAPQDLRGLAQILIDLSLTWAMRWISIQRLPEDIRHSHREACKAQTIIQMQLLLRGILHWQSSSQRTIADHPDSV